MKSYDQGRFDTLKAISKFFEEQAKPYGYCSGRMLAGYLEMHHVDALEHGSQSLANAAFELKTYREKDSLSESKNEE